MNWFSRLCKSSRAIAQREEDEKLARLEQAERELRELQERSARATQILVSRDRRNHWRESIEMMIHGGPA